MPKFSIIIPSARPHYLSMALDSALAQTFEDFEVVISDNSPDAGGADVLKNYSDSRIRYVRPPEPLDATPHWDFAFTHAKGEWVVQLCDDDAILPQLLETLNRHITEHPDVDAIKWQFSSLSRILDEPGKHMLRMPACSGKVKSHSAKDLILKMFDSGSGLFRIKIELPFFPLATFKRTHIEKVREIQKGVLFHAPCPMTSGALSMLALAEQTLEIDLPLTVLGDPPDSAGNAHQNDEMYKEMHKSTVLKYAPIKTMFLFPSTNAESLLRAQKAMGKYTADYQINYSRYFLSCVLAMEELGATGLDVSGLQKMFDEALQTFSGDIKQELENLLSEERGQGKKRSLKAKIQDRVASARRKLKKNDIVSSREWRSDEIDVNDVLSSVHFISQRLQSKSECMLHKSV